MDYWHVIDATWQAMTVEFVVGGVAVGQRVYAFPALTQAAVVAKVTADATELRTALGARTVPAAVAAALAADTHVTF